MKRSRGRSLVVILVAPLLLVAGGCKDSPAVSSVRTQLEREIPGAEFEKEFHLRLGRLSLGMAKGIAGWVLEEEEEDLLRSVKRIDIGTYRVVSLPPLGEVDASPSLMERLGEAGWNLTVRTADEDERVWMFMRHGDEGTIRNIYIVVLDEVELTLVSLEGRLDELLAKAIAADPGAFAAGIGS